MLKTGDEVKIKVKGGKKARGVVTRVEVNTDMLDVTVGGLCPDGPPPDPYRKFMPGRTSVTLTIEVVPE